MAWAAGGLSILGCPMHRSCDEGMRAMVPGVNEEVETSHLLSLR